MAISRDQRYQEIVGRGKYRRLYEHLLRLPHPEWRASFRELEAILGFELPASARLYRPWWANQGAGGGHSQALAWGVAGWETAAVDMDAETLLLRRRNPEPERAADLDELWPAHRAGEWPEGLSLSRADLYEDR